MNEVQKIILTCLLGPEDPTAFARFQKNAYEKERLAKDPEKAREQSRKRSRKSKQKNRDDINRRRREKRKENPEAARNSDAAYRADNLERCRVADRKSKAKRILERPEEVRETRKESRAKRRREHPEEVRAIESADRRRRIATDIEFKLAARLRGRLRKILKAVGANKNESALDLLGCGVDYFKTHLESQFKPGMAWKNHGPVWHIDHIKPCAAFDLTDPQQQKICFHWTNLQPLFALENLQKSDKYVV